MAQIRSLNKYSKLITQSKKHAPAQAMLYALGLTKQDLSKPQIGVGSMWFTGSPCNSKLNLLSDSVSSSMKKSNFIPMQFTVPGVTDGISMGTVGMRYSFPSRELGADSIETVMNAQHYDGLVCIPGCDKNLPASLMGAIRVNRPSIIIYGGSMMPNYRYNETYDIVSAFESYGQFMSGQITEEKREYIVQNSCNKKCGACAGLYTANTMAICLETMGMTPPNSSSNTTGSSSKDEECEYAGRLMSNLLINDLTPKNILTKESFYNAIKMINITGGSTNAVIHLLACAREADINITIDDFNKLNSTPILFNMKPHGQYLMYDLFKMGGTSSVIKYLIQNDVLDGTALTITGQSLYDNVKSAKDINFNNQDIIMPLEDPFQSSGHINILKGNLAPKGCLSKVYDKNMIISAGAKVFDSEEEMIDALNKNQITQDHFVIIRYQGETIGCPEMLTPTSALVGYFGKDNTPPLATDGRFSGGSHGILVAHLEDAFKNDSMTGIIKNGDIITLNTSDNTINLEISDRDRDFRINNKVHKEPDTGGYITKFAKLCRGFDDGYITV